LDVSNLFSVHGVSKCTRTTLFPASVVDVLYVCVHFAEYLLRLLMKQAVPYVLLLAWLHVEGQQCWWSHYTPHRVMCRFAAFNSLVQFSNSSGCSTHHRHGIVKQSCTTALLQCLMNSMCSLVYSSLMNSMHCNLGLIVLRLLGFSCCTACPSVRLIPFV
jgi:hypothetical protein